MLHHIEIYISDLQRSHAFWLNLLALLDYSETAYWDSGFTLHNGTDAYLTFVQVEPKYANLSYHRCGVGLSHIACRANSRQHVDDLHRYCQKNGIACLYDEKYPFANGGKDYYALFIEDPDRIKIECVADQAANES